MTQINNILFFGELNSEDRFPYQVFINTKGGVVIADSDIDNNDYGSLIPISLEDWKEIVKFIEKEASHR